MKTGKKLNVKNMSLFFVFGAVGVLLVLYGTSRYGPGTTHDSAAYIYAAKSILAGKGYIYFGYGTPFIQWPPLYPTLLAAAGGWAFNLVYVSGYINAGVFGLIIVLCGMWMYEHMENKHFSIIGTMGVLFSTPLIQVSIFAWSETLFILLALLSLFNLSTFAKTQRYSTLAAASVFAALACLTRYAGITAIGTGLFILAIQHKKFSKKFVEMFTFGLIAVLPFAVWVIRNYIVSSTFLGMRTPSTTSLKQNIRLTLTTLFSWFTPLGGHITLGKNVLLTAAALTFFVLLSAAVFFIVFFVQSRRNLRDRENAAGPENKYFIIVPFAVFIAFYTAYLIASATSVAFDAISTRLLSPACIPLVLFVFLVADMAVSRLDRLSRRNLPYFFIVFLIAVWSVGPGLISLPALKKLAQNGVGVYASTPWQSSETIGYLRKSTLGGNIYSNYPDVIFLLTGKEAKYTPKKNGFAEYGFDRFKQSVKSSTKSYIVWFNSGVAGSIYNIEDLRPYFDMKEVVKTADGIVYAVQYTQ